MKRLWCRIVGHDYYPWWGIRPPAEFCLRCHQYLPIRMERPIPMGPDPRRHR